MAHILFPLPSLDFDPSEVAVSWSVLTSRGRRVSFSTPDGKPAQADPIMISGRGLDPWSQIPILGNLRLLGLILRANADARRAYGAMTATPAYRSPLVWHATNANDFDALLLGGGHCARGMRQYLESETLQNLVADFFAAGKPVAAICHGVLLAARNRAASGHSALYGRKTTALTWRQEQTASRFAHFGRFWDRSDYRTYVEEAGQPAGFMSVQEEVTRNLASPQDFRDVPANDPDFRKKTFGIARDTIDDASPAWVVQDGNYVSARWPGDAHTFAKTFSKVLDNTASGGRDAR
jgi:putative intracellular protease/amidase